MPRLRVLLRFLLASVAPLALVAACGARSSPPPSGLAFDKRTIDPAYRAEGVAVFDVDRDGALDVVTDEYWYAGPALTPHEIRAPETYDPATQFGHGFGVYPWDVDGDGWLDVVVAPHPTDAMLWYANPRGADVHWASHVVAPVNVAGLETPIVIDLFGDGRPVLLMTDSVQGILGWYEPASDVTLPWILHPIAGPPFPGAARFAHGIGAGDVDGDGRLDVITPLGWFAQTADRATWPSHPASFSDAECSRMFAYDVDGDGRADVICSHPHSYGLHWFQQRADGSFVDHDADETLSQMHALRLDDLDGDGAPELVSGKRWLAHGPATDPGASDPALLVYYAVRRDGAGGATLERHVIDDDSGVGAAFAIADVDGDGRVDVVTSNKKGLFVFHQR